MDYSRVVFYRSRHSASQTMAGNRNDHQVALQFHSGIGLGSEESTKVPVAVAFLLLKVEGNISEEKRKHFTEKNPKFTMI